MTVDDRPVVVGMGITYHPAFSAPFQRQKILGKR